MSLRSQFISTHNMAKLATVGIFIGPIEAHIAKGRLEAEGIPAFIAHEHHIWANWMFSHALGGVKLQVAAENAAEAETILGDHMKGMYESELADEFQDIEANACPRCGSMEFNSKIPFGSLVLLVATLGIGVIFPLRRERHVCLRCGSKWRD